MNPFLDSSDPWLRRAAVVVYCAATAVASLAWTLTGGLEALRAGELGNALLGIPVGLLVWWIAAGIGLRSVRSAARQRGAHSGR